MDRFDEQAQSLFDKLFPKGTVRFLEHRDIIEKALRSVHAERDAEVEKLERQYSGAQDIARDWANIAGERREYAQKFRALISEASFYVREPWTTRFNDILIEIPEEQLRRRG